MTKRLVCRVEDVPDRSLREYEVEGGLTLVVANVDGRFYGFQALCPHQEVPLCDGILDGSTLTCHMHLWQWDVRTGSPLGPAERPLQLYELTQEAGVIYVAGEATAPGIGEASS